MLALSAVTQSPTNRFSDCPAVEKAQESSSPEHTPTAQARKIEITPPKVFTAPIFLAQGGLRILLGLYVATAPQSAAFAPGSGLYPLPHDRRTGPYRARFRRAGWLLW